MKDFVKGMKALSNLNQVRLLKMLQQQSMGVCELQSALSIAQPTVINHLKALEEAGPVTSRKRGPWGNCFNTDGSRRAYVAAIPGSLKHWLLRTTPKLFA